MLYPSALTADPVRFFRRLKDWGYDCVEIAVEDPAEVNIFSITNALKEADLECCSVCGVFPPGRDLRGTISEAQACSEYLKQLIDIARQFESPIVCGPFYSSVGKTELYSEAEKSDQLQQIATYLRPIADYAAEYEVTLVVEALNRYETDYMNTAEQGRVFINEIGHPAVKLHLDTYHMNIEEADPLSALREAGNQLGHMHLSASDRGIPGNDHIDWEAYARVFAEIGYSGTYVIEAFSPEVKSIARAVNHWRDLGHADEIARVGLANLKEIFYPVLQKTVTQLS